jgi:hypothetical protein
MDGTEMVAAALRELLKKAGLKPVNFGKIRGMLYNLNPICGWASIIRARECGYRCTS